MAVLSPSLLPLRMRAGHYRELDVLERLRDGLPSGFEVFHNIALHTLHGGRDRYGEIDIAVLAPTGALLLMEIKAGAVVLREGEVIKLYGERECDVAHQVDMQRAAMQHRLHEAGLKPAIVSCLVLPDYALGDAAVVSVPRERIVDAARFAGLAYIVHDWLRDAQREPVDHGALRRLLLNQFQAMPDLEAMRGQLEGAVRRLADGLATWVPRIDAPSGIYRIQGTAGSGKTQLALQLLDAAASAGQRACYVCFNRTLADHVRQLAPPRAEVVNFHELCVDHWRRGGQEPDFSPEGFRRMAAAYVAASGTFAAALDLLVIDEGQDFDGAWVESLCGRLKPDGRLYLLEDDAQRLYRQDGFELPDAVAIRCSDNFRSPQLVCELINALGLVQPPVRAHNPWRGEVPGIRTYRDDASLVAATEAAVADLVARGFDVGDIALVSGRGRANSHLLNRVGIGAYKTRRFTGEYGPDGEQRWSDGELLVESVYRYKGQSAPAVVVTEFDFAELDEPARRRLFVALTRARMGVELVLSERAEGCLAGAISEKGTI